MNFELLLEAADFLARREASSSAAASPPQVSPAPSPPAPSPPAPKPLYRTIWSRSEEDSHFFREFVDSDGIESRRGTREVHNKLEKNRRAHLKECFEMIKRQLPPGQDNKKASHLSILHNAIKYIQVLRRKDREYEHEMERLAREKIALQQRFAQLKKELSAVWDHLDVGTFMPDDPDESSPDVKFSETDNPKMISFTSRLEPVKTKAPQPSGHLATALISPVQLVASSNPPENGKQRILTISGGPFHSKFKQNQAPPGYTHVVTPLATSHGAIITPVTVVSQGTQIAQIISAPSGKLVSPFNMKPMMSQYLVKHGSTVVVRNQSAPLTQNSSK